MRASPPKNSAKVGALQAAPQAIEICCGSAGLCAAFCRLGIPALGVDWGRNRHVPKSPCLSINMAEASGLAQVIEVLSGCAKLHLAWLGVPRGSASRAREVVRGPDMPPQLRSAEYPEGLPGLTERNAKKVQAADAIYANSLSIIKWCEARSVAWSVENPANSYLWFLPGYVDLLKNDKVKDVLVTAASASLRQQAHARAVEFRPVAMAHGR